MTVKTNTGGADTRPSEQVGDAVRDVVSRDEEPKHESTSPEVDRETAHKALERLRAIRSRSEPVSLEEIIAWRDEGRKY